MHFCFHIRKKIISDDEHNILVKGRKIYSHDTDILTYIISTLLCNMVFCQLCTLVENYVRI